MGTDTNPYLPPEAAVAEPVAVGVAATAAFPVSITKLVVMDLATLGLYQFYWFYQHWAAIRRRTKDKVSPVWRTIFGVIWCYSCFSYIHEEARKQRVDRWLSVGSLTAGWVITTLLARLPDPFWLLSFGSVLFLIPIQREANALNAKLAPDADRNAGFSWANWIWIVFGALFWLLLIAGLMIPPESLES